MSRREKKAEKRWAKLEAEREMRLRMIRLTPLDEYEGGGIVASGGMCAPSSVPYTVPVTSTTIWATGGSYSYEDTPPEVIEAADIRLALRHANDDLVSTSTGHHYCDSET